MSADYWQAQCLELEEQWLCVYCGKPVPQGIQQEMSLCCGEVGHVEAGTRNEMAGAENVAGKD